MIPYFEMASSKVKKRPTSYEQGNPQKGHNYLLVQDGYLVSFTYEEAGNDKYFVSAIVEKDGERVKVEVVETEDNPLSNISVYTLNERLSAEVKKIVANEDYLARNNVLDEVLRSNNPQGELEGLVADKSNGANRLPLRDRSLRYMVNEYSGYKSYWGDQQRRAERRHVKDSGAEPPKEHGVLARDSSLRSLPWHNLPGVDAADPYEVGSAERTHRAMADGPRLMEKRQRQNASVKGGNLATRLSMYKADKLGAGYKGGPPR